MNVKFLNIVFAIVCAGFVSANPVLSKRAAIDDCLKSAQVPVDTAGSSNWTADIAPYNRRLAYTPAAVAVPTSVAHVQSAVKCAAQVGIKVNAKSGGHSYASFGLGGENGHLVIELDRMYNVTVDSSTYVATIQGGARLGHVATQLYNQGQRAISHGTCPG
jgi:FAD/FMN-containing dehydrogenase